MMIKMIIKTTMRETKTVTGLMAMMGKASLKTVIRFDQILVKLYLFKTDYRSF
jgi:hypothetical protein